MEEPAQPQVELLTRPALLVSLVTKTQAGMICQEPAIQVRVEVERVLLVETPQQSQETGAMGFSQIFQEPTLTTEEGVVVDLLL